MNPYLNELLTYPDLGLSGVLRALGPWGWPWRPLFGLCRSGLRGIYSGFGAQRAQNRGPQGPGPPQIPPIWTPFGSPFGGVFGALNGHSKGYGLWTLPEGLPEGPQIPLKYPYFDPFWGDSGVILG